jgi:hypothetical protein
MPRDSTPDILAQQRSEKKSAVIRRPSLLLLLLPFPFLFSSPVRKVCQFF